jgi:hypothetical protein
MLTPNPGMTGAENAYHFESPEILTQHFLAAVRAVRGAADDQA